MSTLLTVMKVTAEMDLNLFQLTPQIMRVVVVLNTILLLIFHNKQFLFKQLLLKLRQRYKKNKVNKNSKHNKMKSNLILLNQIMLKARKRSKRIYSPAKILEKVNVLNPILKVGLEEELEEVLEEELQSEKPIPKVHHRRLLQVEEEAEDEDAEEDR
jgi:hypothetical protein